MCGLVARIRDRADVFVELIDGGLCHGLWCGEGMEKVGSDEVDALVGALGREDDSHEEFEGVVVVELCLGVGIVLDEVVDDGSVALFLGHGGRGDG